MQNSHFVTPSILSLSPAVCDIAARDATSTAVGSAATVAASASNAIILMSLYASSTVGKYLPTDYATTEVIATRLLLGSAQSKAIPVHSAPHYIIGKSTLKETLVVGLHTSRGLEIAVIGR